MKTGNTDKVSLVVTAPFSFSINTRTTMSVVTSMINDSKRNILITGYSLSSYFSELIDTIIKKASKAYLSYHGQQGNIEIGTLIESKQIAKQIEDILTKLTFSKIFDEV